MNGFVVLAACVCAASGQLVAPTAWAPGQSHQYHAQDEFGQYSFGYAGGPSARTETRDGYGVVRGTIVVPDANGILQTQNYIADAAGFRIVGTNLPVAPAAVPAVALAGPAPVAETAEVAAARAEFETAYAAAAAAAAAAPEEP